MLTLEKLLERSDKLGTMPEIVNRIFEVMDNPKSTATQIGRIINDDPALTARLLKLVNSPFYGFASKVDTVYRAIALIGHQELRSVVLATSAVKIFEGIPSDLVSMPMFWRRSLNTAVVARVLAAFQRQKEIERYFIAGLLHNIGSLVLYLQMPDEMNKALAMQTSEHMPLWQAEDQVMSFNHADVGGALLKKWNLPPVLYQAVTFHLYPEDAPEIYQPASMLVHLANQIEIEVIEPLAQGREPGEIDAGIWQANGLSSDILETVLEKAEQQYSASKDIFLS